MRTAELKDALHRNCAPNILVLPTSPVCRRHRTPPLMPFGRHRRCTVADPPVTAAVAGHRGASVRGGAGTSGCRDVRMTSLHPLGPMPRDAPRCPGRGRPSRRPPQPVPATCQELHARAAARVQLPQCDRLPSACASTACGTLALLARLPPHPAWQAEAIARKNELSFIDLLRPFSQVDTSSVAINTTREQVTQLPGQRRTRACTLRACTDAPCIAFRCHAIVTELHRSIMHVSEHRA